VKESSFLPCTGILVDLKLVLQRDPVWSDGDFAKKIGLSSSLLQRDPVWSDGDFAKKIGLSSSLLQTNPFWFEGKKFPRKLGHP